MRLRSHVSGYVDVDPLLMLGAQKILRICGTPDVGWLGREIGFSSGVQQGNAMGPALFCVLLLPVLKRIRVELSQEV